MAGPVSELRGGLRDSVGGAKLGVLQDGLAGVVKGKRGFGDLIGPVTGDDNNARGVKAAPGRQSMMQHRHTGQWVEHFGQVGIHPCAHARRQNTSTGMSAVP